MPPFIEVSRHGEVFWISAASVVTIGPHFPAGSVLRLMNQTIVIVDQSPPEVLGLLENGWKAH